jgi:two-component system chemotaxis response regulator CheB
MAVLNRRLLQPGERIRVLVVDDSVVIRRLVAHALEEEPLIDVVGSASNGVVALQRIPQMNPDVVTLDIEMPEMDGLETLRHIQRDYPQLRVIMFSTLTERGAGTTLDALALGASDYVTKPANVGSVIASLLRIREELVPKIKGLCGRSPVKSGLQGSLARPPGQETFSSSPGSPDCPGILAIGVSTGGPNALATLLPELTQPLPVPVVIVQHMPPLFTRLLADRIRAVTGLIAREGEAGAVLNPGEVWIAPGGFHMEVERSRDGVHLRTHEGPFENSCRPAVDVLFRSVAQTYGARSLGVVLTGMGQDGLRGCEWIREAGGQVLAQDEATSVVWGMPGAVSQAGLAEKVLPLLELAPEIDRRLHVGQKLLNYPTSRTGAFSTTGKDAA